jgi:beta-lactamase superfamily II metal-dependent hydrolase
MGFEIDFLPVGDGEKSGDAIALRYGNLTGPRDEFFVAVIDGGFKDSGEKLVEHIKQYYGTKKVDTVISTHPDNDHLSGLEVILENMVVGELWMHQPWKHTDDMACMFKDGRVTDNSVKESLRKSLETACSIEKLAAKKGIPIYEPFTGRTDIGGGLVVVGPTQEYYESLIPGFRGTPEPKEALGIVEKFFAKAEEVIKKVLESLDIETLKDDGETSAENNTCAIVLLQHDSKYALFTADAGTPALSMACDILERSGYDPKQFAFTQVPHHGSQRNVGPVILDRLVGEKLEEEKKIKTAFVSVSKDGDPKHPNKKVTNAFRRRGAPVHVTKGMTKRHHHNAPPREGWVASEPLPLYTEVEE